MANINLITKNKPKRYPANLRGLRFGKLTVLRVIPVVKGRQLWECACDCGQVVKVRRDRLVVNHTRSCGCLFREVAGRSLRTHGLSHTAEYNSWARMNARCNNPNRPEYYRYGGRGIKICQRWRVFENFLADMGKRPTLEHSLDRINNDGDYEPSNCRWATAKQQSANTRRNVRLTYDGKTQCISEWERTLGFKPGLIGMRLSSGWSVERALSTPVLTIDEVSALGLRARWYGERVK